MKILFLFEMAIQPHGADLQIVRLLDGIRLIQRGIQQAADRLALIDVNALGGIDKDAQVPYPAFLDVLHVIQLNPHLRNDGSGNVADDRLNVFLHTLTSLKTQNKSGLRCSPLYMLFIN